MPNINLLPADLKRKEDKELQKLSKRARKNKIEWNNPSKRESVNLYSDVPKESFWTKVFGTRNTNIPSNYKPSVSMKPAAVPLVQRTNFMDYVAPKINNTVPPKISNPIPPKPKAVKKNIGDGWLDALGSIFAPHAKKNSWKTAGSDLSRDKLVKESLNLSKDKTWENYSKPHITPIQKESREFKEPHTESHAKIYDVPRKEPVHTPLDQGKQAKKAVAIKSQQGKYHLAPKKMAGEININLIPEELISVRKPKFISQIIAFLLVIIIAGLTIGGLSYFIGFKSNQIEQEIATNKAELDQLNAELLAYREAQTENYSIVKKILTIDNVLRGHIYWTKFFALLEKYTIDNAYYSSFSATVAGKFSLPVTARDYGSALAQIAAFNSAKDFTKEVKVDSMHILSNDKKGSYGVGFDLKMDLADGVFKK